MSRLTAHKKANALLQRGDYAAAVAVIEESLKEFGPHVGPLSDLVFAAYLNQDMGLFSRSVEKLEEEFQKAGPKLSAGAEARTRVALAKAYELLGRVAEAFSEIDSALELIGKGDPLALQVKCQKLRLLASFGRESEVNELYRHCLGISESDPQQAIECFHALLLAETRLFGLEATWPRFLHLSKNPDLQAADLRLCLIDLLEVALESRDKASRDLILGYIRKKKITDFDQYEFEILRMAEHPASVMNAADVFEWTRAIPYFGIIRLLALELLRGDQPRPEIQKQLAFHLRTLDHRSRRMVERKWPKILKNPEGVEVVLRPATLTLDYGNTHLSFAKSRQGWESLMVLAEARQIAPGDMLARLGRKDNFQNLESLRIALLRLNTKLTVFLSLDWVIRFGKEKISFNPAVRCRLE